ncbi:hypothetical protein GCM10010372_34700 [Streptomyces tauricus]|nr:hypothetical protein GCM10010372_34700 [Streptomyces tauricus]
MASGSARSATDPAGLAELVELPAEQAETRSPATANRVPYARRERWARDDPGLRLVYIDRA